MANLLRLLESTVCQNPVKLLVVGTTAQSYPSMDRELVCACKYIDDVKFNARTL